MWGGRRTRTSHGRQGSRRDNPFWIEEKVNHLEKKLTKAETRSWRNIHSATAAGITGRAADSLCDANRRHERLRNKWADGERGKQILEYGLGNVLKGYLTAEAIKEKRAEDKRREARRRRRMSADGRNRCASMKRIDGKSLDEQIQSLDTSSQDPSLRDGHPRIGNIQVGGLSICG